MNKNRLTAGITMGDPLGVGPEIILKALKEEKILKLANFIILGNAYVLEKTAQLSKIKLKVDKVKNTNELHCSNTANPTLLEIGEISNLTFGRPSQTIGLAALKCIQAALRLIKSKKIDVLITAPVNKHAINQAWLQRISKDQAGLIDNKCGAQARLPGLMHGAQAANYFTGHTEYLANKTKTKNFLMMLVGGSLRIALVTRHIALKDVTKALTKERIYETIRLTTFALKKYFRIIHPKIGVCGLNPHSGDAGMFGEEEATVIQPAIKKAKRMAFIEGPLPADTLFYSAHQKRFDCIVAMYHDQGLIPLKMLAFHQGVNLTIGLPFVRTSPDHGTAYNIAGKNKANPGSMIEAIKLAVEIGQRLKKK